MKGLILKEFVEDYCQDIVKEYYKKKDGSILSFDAVITNDLGESVKVIYDDENNPIDVNDIIQLSTPEFMTKYHFNSAIKAMEKYLSAYEILSPEELFMEANKAIQSFNTELDKWSEMSHDFL